MVLALQTADYLLVEENVLNWETLTKWHPIDTPMKSADMSIVRIPNLRSIVNRQVFQIPEINLSASTNP
jgi:hypothetical protein